MGGLIEIWGLEVGAIYALLYVWFVLAALSTAYVAWDNFVNKNPEETVMKWGWILIALYMGPVALALYVMAEKEPRPGEHEEFIRPLWKQGVGSTVHCIAGDVTGIITAAIITAALGLPMWIDLVVEYTAGFAFGLFVFQALFMKGMMGGTYLKAVTNSFIPEWFSMNMMAAGMFPVMIFLMMGRDMRAMEPTEPLFWGVMSLGVIVGYFTAYPVNVWMVSKNLKHGFMHVDVPSGSVAKPGGQANPETGGDAAEMIFDGEELDTDRDTISGAGGADLIDVRDEAADDKAECGAGHDTVYFDQELELIFPDECEEKNPVPNTLQERRAATEWEGPSPTP